jgi:hypothetical protein
LNAGPYFAGSDLNLPSSCEPHNPTVIAKVKAKIKSPRAAGVVVVGCELRVVHN